MKRMLKVEWMKWRFADSDSLKRQDSGHESGIGQETTGKKGDTNFLQKDGAIEKG